MSQTQKPEKVSFTRPEWILLGLLAAINFTHIVDFMILMPLGPMLMRLFEIGPGRFGLLVSSYTFTAGISVFMASFFIDRFDRKNALLYSYAGFAAGTIGCALAPTFEILLIARSATGMFGGALGSLVLSVVADAIPYNRRGSAMGIVMGSFSVASVVGVPFALKLSTMFTWHAPFLFLGGLSLTILALVAYYMKPMTAHLTEAQEGSKILRRSPLETIVQIGRSGAQKWAIFFSFALVFGQFTIIPYMSQSFVSNAGLREDQLPLIYLFGGLCSMFASPLAGRLSDRYSKHRVFLISALVSMIPIFVITHLGEQPHWLVLLVSSSFFIVMSGRMVPAMAMISSAAPPATRGSFMSIMSAVQQMSLALASFLAGLIVSNQNGRFVHYDRVGYIAIAFSFVAMYAASRLPRGQA